jgi:hypothetical protein
MKDIQYRLPGSNVPGVDRARRECIETVVALLNFATVAVVAIPLQENVSTKVIVGCKKY